MRRSKYLKLLEMQPKDPGGHGQRLNPQNPSCLLLSSGDAGDHTLLLCEGMGVLHAPVYGFHRTSNSMA